MTARTAPRRRRAAVAALAGLAMAGCGGSDKETGSTLDAVAGGLGQVIEQGRDQLMKLAELPEARGADARRCSTAMATAFEGAPPRYTSFGAAHRDGNLFCISTPNAPPVDIADRAYFRRAVSERAFAVGEYQIGRVTRKQSLGLGYPLLGRGARVDGIVLASIDLAWLDGWLRGPTRGSRARWWWSTAGARSWRARPRAPGRWEAGRPTARC